MRFRSSIAHDISRLEQTAEEGDIPTTPLLVVAAIWIVCALAVAVVTAAVYLAIHFATS